MAHPAHRSGVHRARHRCHCDRWGEPPEAKEGGQKIVDHYVDNKDSIQISSLLATIAGAALIFFFGYVRKVLRAAEGENGMLSVVALVGAAIMATGIAIDSMIAFALAEAAEDIEPVAAQALEALWDNDFFPIALGTMVVLLADRALDRQTRRAAEMARLDRDRARSRKRDPGRVRRHSSGERSGS